MLSCKKREFVLRSSICAAAACVMLGWQWPTVAKEIKEVCFLTNMHYSACTVTLLFLGYFGAKRKRAIVCTSLCFDATLLTCLRPVQLCKWRSSSCQLRSLWQTPRKSLCNYLLLTPLSQCLTCVSLGTCRGFLDALVHQTMFLCL